MGHGYVFLLLESKGLWEEIRFIHVIKHRNIQKKFPHNSRDFPRKQFLSDEGMAVSLKKPLRTNGCLVVHYDVIFLSKNKWRAKLESIFTTSTSSVEDFRDQKMQTALIYWLVHFTLNVIQSSLISVGQHQDGGYWLQASHAAWWGETLWTAQLKTVC